MINLEEKHKNKKLSNKKDFDITRLDEKFKNKHAFAVECCKLAAKKIRSAYNRSGMGHEHASAQYSDKAKKYLNDMKSLFNQMASNTQNPDVSELLKQFNNECDLSIKCCEVAAHKARVAYNDKGSGREHASAQSSDKAQKHLDNISDIFNMFNNLSQERNFNDEYNDAINCCESAATKAESAVYYKDSGLEYASAEKSDLAVQYTHNMKNIFEKTILNKKGSNISNLKKEFDNKYNLAVRCCELAAKKAKEAFDYEEQGHEDKSAELSRDAQRYLSSMKNIFEKILSNEKDEQHERI